MGKSTIQTKKCDRFPFPSFNGCKHGCFLPLGIEKPEPSQCLITLRVRGLCKGVSATATSGEPTALLRLIFSKTAAVPRRKQQITQAKGGGCPTPQTLNCTSTRTVTCTTPKAAIHTIPRNTAAKQSQATSYATGVLILRTTLGQTNK